MLGVGRELADTAAPPVGSGGVDERQAALVAMAAADDYPHVEAFVETR